MSKLPPKPKKNKGMTREELVNLDKNELIDKILHLEAHNVQLKNIISKNLPGDANIETDAKKNKFDFSKCHYRRVLLSILYFGWDYHGLAMQEDSSQTIEHHLFHAMTKACLIENRANSQYHRCGRTDKGVSAFGQVISITLRSKHPKDKQHLPDSVSSEMPYCKILNRLLPKEIRAVSWMPIPDDKPDYSARFDCKKRQYKYYFPRSNLNLDAMQTACLYLVGSNDYRNLCKMDVGNGVTEFRREIFTADILAVDNEDDNPTSMYCLVIEGNAFLWHQIRCIMAILFLVGQGKEEPSVVRELLDVEKNPRKPQYDMALDIPLNLFHCSYEVEHAQNWVFDEDELKAVIAHLQSEWTMENIKSTMIKDCVNELKKEYTKLCSSKTTGESEQDRVMAYTDCLIQGVKPKNYTPLLKRDTCSSLEEKIDHYRKKKKLDDAREDKF